VRSLVALALLLSLLAGPSLARAGRELTPAQAAQVYAIANRVKAERQAKIDRRRAASDKKKRVRAAKMAAALDMAADYKADKARKKSAQDAARKREDGKRNAARLRFLEELLRTRR
jgi:hypothetical protein